MLLNCGVGEVSWKSLGCKEIQPIHPKGDQSWVFIGRIDVEAETLLLWPPNAKSWLIAKDPDAGKDWGQEEKGKTEDEMLGWHHQLDGHGFGWIPGVGDGQGGLVCCSPWGCKESDTTEWLNWTELNNNFIIENYLGLRFIHSNLMVALEFWISVWASKLDMQTTVSFSRLWTAPWMAIGLAVQQLTF